VVVGGDRHIRLLDVGVLILDLYDLGTILGEHGVQRIPYNIGSSILGHLTQHVFIHRGNDGAEDELVLSLLAKIIRIWSLMRSFTEALGELHGWHLDGAVHVAELLVSVKST
jgi:hypothetical protein